MNRAKEAGKDPQIVALIKRLKTGLITCETAKDNANGEFGTTIEFETACALIQDWAIAAIQCIFNEDIDLQSETSSIAQEVCQILTAWLPDFVVLNFTLELSEDMQIVAKPIVGADTRKEEGYLASAHLEIRMKRGEIPEGLPQILNRFKV